jgi:glucose dehydrogenase
LAVRSGDVREPSVAESVQNVGWRSTEGGAGSGCYLPLADINRDKVKRLKVAWCPIKKPVRLSFHTLTDI